jgi:hypothetical protein
VLLLEGIIIIIILGLTKEENPLQEETNWAKEKPPKGSR